MFKVLPIFPLYPSPTYLQYNVSLGIPGPKLWEIPKIGPFAKKNNYPNSTSSILMPDVEYIKKFANYELGIADAILKAAQQKNIAKIKDPKVRETFDRLYGSSTEKTGVYENGMGFQAIEKVILAAAFESQKPYFEIAQLVIKSLSKIEDIIARVCPLIGASTNSSLATIIKSRKPKGNGPLESLILGPFGTPVAIGYKGGESINKEIDKLNTLMQKGDGVKISDDGKYTKVPKKFKNENNNISEGYENLNFTYVTISTIYSNGVFDPTTKYVYKYVDIDEDETLPDINTPPEEEFPDNMPDKIILGIFTQDGTEIDPSSKIQYWGVSSDGLDLERKNTLFEKAPWIRGDKWIFDKSIDYSNINSWKTLDSPIYIWRKSGNNDIKSENSPGDGWEKIKYKDVLDFNTEENKYLKYLEDDFIVEFKQDTIKEYREYYDSLISNSLNRYKVPGDKRTEIISKVEKLLSDKSPNDKIIEQIRTVIKYGDLKNTYYKGIDLNDWDSNVSPSSVEDIPLGLKKVFKPMRFNIKGETVWIDPEIDYDIKVIKIVPSTKIDSNISMENSSPENMSSSEIRQFVKNQLLIRVFKNSVRKIFNIEVSNNGNIEKYTNIEEYVLSNWNLTFVNGDRNINNDNSFKIKLSFDTTLSNGKIGEVFFFEETINIDTKVPNIEDGIRVLPGFYKKNILNLNLDTIKPIEDYDGASIEILDIPPFEIEIYDSQKTKTVSTDINSLNELLSSKSSIDKLYSKGRYGSGYKGGLCLNDKGFPVLDDNNSPIIEPDSPQFFGYNRRTQVTELDLEVYYIIEGYKKSKNEEEESKKPDSPNNTGSSSGSSSKDFYKMPAAIGISKQMIDLTIDISMKLLPAITKLIELLKNPSSFITAIIQAKVEDHVLIFNPRVTKIMDEIVKFRNNYKSSNDEGEKKSIVKDMKTFVKSSEIKNYLYVDDNAEFRFVIDGPALIGFFGILFGIELNIGKAFDGGLPIKPIFSNSNSKNGLEDIFSKLKIYDENKGQTNNQNGKDLEEKLLKNLDINKPDDSSLNKIVSKNGDEEYYEEVSTTYSTGRFIDGVDYKYIYINQEIESIIRDADELISKSSEIDYSGTASNSIDNLQLASEKYQQAYDLIDKDDKSKDSLKKLLIDKIKSIKDKVNIISQPLFKLILGVVTLPLKVIFSILKWLLDFFKKLVNPLEFPALIAEFLSFQWIMQFFTPKGLLDIAGIKFKPEKLAEWCAAVNVPNPQFGKDPKASKYLIPDDYEIADLNEFLSVGFEARLPIYNAKQYRDLCLRPFRIFNIFFCFIEKVINSFIMLIWSVMGITAVIPPPLLNLCKNISENIDMVDLKNLINGLFDDISVSAGSDNNGQGVGNTGANSNSYDFIYEVKMPDGTISKELDRESLQKIIDENKDLNFDFLNFETLE